jgi:hypothetical protein
MTESRIMVLQLEPAPLPGASIGAAWRRWGPYLSERQWGTVREDYSATGEAWDSFPHDQARSRAYRWGEDGLLGISDDRQLLCFALSLWNGNDAILKERLFGLTGSEGNHGEDVKEYYYYLDATPTHSYLRGLYKYPQRAFPYADLVQTNRARGRQAPEYELIDTGVFADNAYFDVQVEYAKAAPDDIAIRIEVTNRGPEFAHLEVLPTLWFRNTWDWGDESERPELRAVRKGDEDTPTVRASHPQLVDFWLACDGQPTLLFTENETNAERLWGGANRSPFVKDGIDAFVVAGNDAAVNPAGVGTKCAARYSLEIEPQQTSTVQLRLSNARIDNPFLHFDDIFATRRAEADALYAGISADVPSEDEARVQRQALSGLIWSKQFYYFDVARWLEGDPSAPVPPLSRSGGRNARWKHHRSADVISMPDKWEYPWYAAWDLAFHAIAFGLIDPGFAKDQLLLLTNERYIHPNGQLPAYEWAFGDVNPPVHILAARSLFIAERERSGTGDSGFLARIFHKLLLNFTWWVNRKDANDRNVFEGGFLGLDNISVIDRSMVLPEGLTLEQADGTAWMATYCLGMTWAALMLAESEPNYGDLAVTFFEHFMSIGDALNGLSDPNSSLWDEEDGFYYDELRRSDGAEQPLKVRSLVGLLPIVSAVVVTPEQAERLADVAPNVVGIVPDHLARHPKRASLLPSKMSNDGAEIRLFTLVPEDRLRRILARAFDPNEFLGDYGIRSISRVHLEHPYVLEARGQHLTIQYEPAESSTGMFGGNSNWRGPVWFPMNFLLVQGLRNLYRYYGDDFRVEYPTGSGTELTLDQIAGDIAQRLVSTFLRDGAGRRPVFGGTEIMQTDPNWRDHLLFYEYFHGDNGAGIGASHQTGWTALVANLIGHTPPDDRVHDPPVEHRRRKT